jgi:PhnB protein
VQRPTDYFKETSTVAIIPHLCVPGAANAIEFYQKAFDATEVLRMPHEDGRLMHAELKIGDQKLMLCDDFPEFCPTGKSRTAKSLGGTPITLHLESPNCDASIAKAAAAGATVTMPAADLFWGDRYGQVTDPFGIVWSFAHPLKK